MLNFHVKIFLWIKPSTKMEHIFYVQTFLTNIFNGSKASTSSICALRLRRKVHGQIKKIVNTCRCDSAIDGIKSSLLLLLLIHFRAFHVRVLNFRGSSQS